LFKGRKKKKAVSGLLIPSIDPAANEAATTTAEKL
jgi:hypothetical protein